MPIIASLKTVVGCAAGAKRLVVYAHWRNGDGRRFTGVRGVGPLGKQTWSREIADEAQIRAHPSGIFIVITYGGTAKVTDTSGRTVTRYPGTLSAAYTADGKVVHCSDSDTEAFAG